MPRGRPRKETYWLYFNLDFYIRDFRKAMYKVMRELQQDMYDRLIAEAEKLPFVNVSVYTTEGETSDLKRKSAFLNSFVKYRVQEIEKGVISAVVETMAKNFKESHIGLYYEYGTGVKEAPDSPLPWMGDWNPLRGARRTGAEIVTRDKDWEDAGGNIRIARSKVGGFPLRSEKYNIPAQRWFEKAFEAVKDTYIEKILRTLDSLDPFDPKYFKVQPVINMGNK